MQSALLLAHNKQEGLKQNLNPSLLLQILQNLFINKTSFLIHLHYRQMRNLSFILVFLTNFLLYLCINLPIFPYLLQTYTGFHLSKHNTHLGPINLSPFRCIICSGISAIHTSVSQANFSANFL